MAYVSPNFKTKKALIEAFQANKPIRVYEPGLGQVPTDGPVLLEGPHSPKAHMWYAIGTMEAGKLVKVE